MAWMALQWRYEFSLSMDLPLVDKNASPEALGDNFHTAVWRGIYRRPPRQSFNQKRFSTVGLAATLCRIKLKQKRRCMTLLFIQF